MVAVGDPDGDTYNVPFTPAPPRPVGQQLRVVGLQVHADQVGVF
jgi:hypothetical protein